MPGVVYQRLFESLPSPHLVLTPALEIAAVNTAYLALVDMGLEELLGRYVFEVFPPTPDAVDEAGRPLLGRAFQEALDTARPASVFVQRYDVADAATGEQRERWWSHTVTPVLDAAGRVLWLVQRVDEVTDYVRTQQAAQLADAAAGEGSPAVFDELQAQLYARSVALQEAGDAQQRTSRILEAMPSGFLSMDTQWRFTVLNAAAERLLGHPRAELLGRTIWEAFPDTVGNEFEQTYRKAVDTAVPQSLEAYYPAPLDTWFEILCWPTPEGLSLYFADIDARKRAAAEAERASARLALLAEVNGELLRAEDVPAAVAGVAERLVPALADGCFITLLAEDGRPQDVGSWHVDPARRGALRDYLATRLEKMPAGSPLARMLATGEVVRSNAGELGPMLTNDRARKLLARLGVDDGILLPIRGRNRGRIVGGLSLFNAAGRARDPEDERTAVEIAARMGLALDSYWLANSQSQLAEGLQRNLLTPPPEPDHAHIVVRYVPASESARVGGDWYDAFLQRSGATMLVIGDVAGHDVAAAADMAQLRSLLRGIAVHTSAGPAEALRGLDSAMQLLGVRTLATAVVARLAQTQLEFDRGETRLVWSNAGHPPPLVIHPDGRQQMLDERRAELLLGVDPETPRTEQTITLERDATVLLYSDGLVERRDADLDAGIARLQQAVRDLEGSTLDELCDGLIERLVDGHPDDDVALAAIRLFRQDQPRPAEAGPNDVPPGVPPDHSVR